MKERGEQITYTLDVPLVAYTGDTSMGETLLQPGVMDAKILISECTFFDADHKHRARVGQHIHVTDFLDVLPQLKNELVLLSHVSRRTYLRAAKEMVRRAMEQMTVTPRVEFLMDFAQRLTVRPGRAARFAVDEKAIKDERN